MASFTITPLTDHTGAEVTGLDFTQPIDIETHATLKRAFAERHVLVGGAASKRDRGIRWLETGKFHVHSHGADGERRQRGDATVVGRHGDWRARCRCDDDGGRWDAGARLVDDDQAQLRLVVVLRENRSRNEEPEKNEQESLHLVNVFPLRLGLILKLLISHSSLV